MPFGVVNGPSHFSLIIDWCLRGINGVFVFIDDILVVAKDVDDMLNRLRNVFEKLIQFGLKISVSKSYFGMKEVTYLGFDVNESGVSPAKKNVSSMRDWISPRDKSQLKTALGGLGFYRNHVKDFSTIPLYDLTSEKSNWNWGEEEEQAFRKLIEGVCQRINSNHPDWEETFYLRTDASEKGGGAELFQRYGLEHNTIAFYSFRFSKSQNNYSAVQKECLAIVKSIQHFRYYLEGRNLY